MGRRALGFWGLGTAMNGLIGAFNLFIGAFNFLFGWLTGQIPTIPYLTLPQLAEGGIVFKPTMALMGERGPEVVAPLSALPGLLGASGGGRATININLSQQRLSTIMLRELTSQNVNDSGVGFAPIRTG